MIRGKSDVKIMIGCLLRRTVGFALVWWVATEGNFTAWPLAVIAVAVTVAVSLRLLPPGSTPGLSLSGMAGFVGYFFRQSIRGGFQVSRLALQRQLQLRPAILELPVTLPTGLPRLLLIATLGLMPGTLGVRLEDDLLYLHVLDTGLPVVEETAQLSGHIARMLGVNR
ncbi:MAG: Na+/H+ antiporter subunit E [Trichlorobacter sp.]|uniref:Na+/H+ antiporter subunit E n=1 Tax=Trichlorobacter sp. TaxID=2911007 RepID=UPI0025676B86|nr:Na+/H+ antiporter subunit E [Trichlorobacter sp.]MDK9719025.1 Na+/H+ antiporter subunit E [Trichlorobacter sp.]